MKPMTNFKQLYQQIIDKIHFIGKKTTNNNKLVVFPELILQQFGNKLFKFLDLPTNFFNIFRTLAKLYNLYISIGLYTHQKLKYYNTTYIFSPYYYNPIIYNKLHLFPIENLGDLSLSPGNKLTTFYIDKYKIGIMTCYDLRFSSEIIKYRNLNCDIVIVPTAWIEKKNKPNELINIAISVAKLGSMYICIANMTGKLDKLIWSGQSVIISPKGEILTQLNKNKQGISYYNFN